MACLDLIIAGVKVAPRQSYELTQSYEPIEAGRITQRMQSGMLRTFTVWQKLRTTISGTGEIPTSLSQIDWTQDVIIDCIAPRATQGGASPTAVRATQGTITVYDAAGAAMSVTTYYPRLTCRSAGPRETGNVRSHAYGWELVAEEI